MPSFNVPCLETQPSQYCTLNWYKFPGESYDLSLDWTSWLIGGDTIASAAWGANPGISILGSTYTPTSTSARISGGTAGSDYYVAAKVTTALGRTEVRSIRMRVRTC